MIAPTADAARAVMVEGDSGILSVCWPGDPMGAPDYEPSKRRITWENGATVHLFSAEEPERLRGPQCEFFWGDEMAAWGGSKSKELQEKIRQMTWDMAMFGLRLGDHPQALVTTTPKPSTLLRKLLADPKSVVSRGSTFDNAANLAPSFLEEIREKYDGTRLGRQELYAEMLLDVPGALWTEEMFPAPLDELPELARVVVGVDPSGASGDEDESNNSIGIVVAAKTAAGDYVVIEDASCALSPAGWAKRVVAMLDKHDADKIVAEVNYGGAMVVSNIRTVRADAPVKKVTASRGKAVRAEPIAALYEQGKVRHMRGLGALEDQMTKMTLNGYEGDGSPDRVDALVWALTELSSRRGTHSFYVGGQAVA